MADYHSKFLGKDDTGAPLEIGVRDGVIVAVGGSLDGEGEHAHDFGDAMLLPGWIDAHVHFNEPGRADWEGLATGSQALAAGGGTVFFDMPLNSSPPVFDAASLLEKKALAEKKSWTDFALWGGLIPHSLTSLPEMARAGAVGFKAFLCDSGLTEFPATDRATLIEAAKVAADLNLPIAVHAEVPVPNQPPPSGTDYHAWCRSRPVTMELAGIELALEACEKSGAAFHIVHVSSPEGVDLIQQAKAEGLNITLETCPHYLLLDEENGAAIGNLAKCAPPLRPRDQVEALWNRLNQGLIDTLGSDHSPCPPELKTSSNIFEVWGGIAGIQHGLPLVLSRNPSLSCQISQKVAERFRLPAKGGLRVGVDADFIVLQKGSFPIEGQSSLTRHPHSSYLGMTSSWQVAATYLRGEAITGPGRAQFLTPQAS
ncbi:allantoinase AllB [Roseibacillus persicicus]|uniref:Allantoinase n=1 Tax=Roseibacillus persicicus TaxID=454148 RepID=A0A918TLE3_9BACT|nr:allantoinase AllB [Roseibacillus persicicus]GHC50200.1 allantoinase [Roseibacillus persicicus]